MRRWGRVVEVVSSGGSLPLAGRWHLSKDPKEVRVFSGV